MTISKRETMRAGFRPGAGLAAVRPPARRPSITALRFRPMGAEFGAKRPLLSAQGATDRITDFTRAPAHGGLARGDRPDAATIFITSSGTATVPEQRSGSHAYQ
jgi:hypothetical protein